MKTTTVILSLFMLSGVVSAQSPDTSKWVCRNLADSGYFLYEGESIFGSQACRPIPQTTPAESTATLPSAISKVETPKQDTPIANSVAAPVRSAPQATTTAPAKEVSVSIEAPKSDASNANSGFPRRWKSLTAGNVRTLRFEGEYIYAEVALPEAAAKAGTFILTEAKKDGDKYVGKTSGRALKTQSGPICSVAEPIEFTLVTTDRIEGRSFTPPVGAALNWGTCSYSPAPNWQSFIWIPVR
jgi:hypothetical protein